MATFLVRKYRFGQPTYAICYDDGEPLRFDTRAGETPIQITDEQAKLGLDACAAMFETGRLAK